MRKLVFALLLVAVLLSLFAGVALATCPEYEDPIPPGTYHANENAQVHDLCIQIPSQAAANGHFAPCPPP